jgi:hypothetical protein
MKCFFCETDVESWEGNPKHAVCPKCLKILKETFTQDKEEYSAPAAVRAGWVCPVCGRGVSPYLETCPCQPPPKYEVTCRG